MRVLRAEAAAMAEFAAFSTLPAPPDLPDPSPAARRLARDHTESPTP